MGKMGQVCWNQTGESYARLSRGSSAGRGRFKGSEQGNDTRNTTLVAVCKTSNGGSI